LVFVVLVVVLAGVLVAFYVSQTGPYSREETVKQLVEEAVLLVEQKGEAAFPDFRDEGSKWFYGDTYVFVWRTDGIRVVYPPNPSGEGQNMVSLTDANGKEIGKLFIEIALSEKGEGWVDYEWPKPNETEASGKRTFIKLATLDGQKYLVGSGFYVD
jgi:signal transduction histidine kinase